MQVRFRPRVDDDQSCCHMAQTVNCEVRVCEMTKTRTPPNHNLLERGACLNSLMQRVLSIPGVSW